MSNFPQKFSTISNSFDCNEVKTFKFNKENNRLFEIDYKIKCILGVLIILMILMIMTYIQLFSFEKNINNRFKKLDKISNYSTFLSNLSLERVDKSINKISNDFQNSQFESQIELDKFINDTIFRQTDFCLNPEKYYNINIENITTKVEVEINQYSYKMFVYDNKKRFDIVSDSIIEKHNWEKSLALEMIRAIKYYAQKNNITDNKNITIIDIGANVGSHTMILAKLNYSVISFEPLETNFYILRKNICLNNFTNVIIFNVGLFNQEKLCEFYVRKRNYGDGVISCGSNRTFDDSYIKGGLMTLTKLSNYYPYLFSKKIALIKIDVEGAEGKAMESGYELISKYHVPFIITEFFPIALINNGISPKNYIKIYIDNGYKMSMNGFFPDKYDNLETVINKAKGIIDLFFIYKDYAK